MDALKKEVAYQNDRYQEWLEGDHDPRISSKYQRDRDAKLQKCCNQYDSYLNKVDFLRGISVKTGDNIATV